MSHQNAETVTSKAETVAPKCRKWENSLVQEGADDHPHQAEERRGVAHVHGADSHGERAL